LPAEKAVVAGRWRLDRFLGEGAVGVVYEASHVLIGRRAAVKILKPELLKRADVRASFLREARAVNWVNHPNIAEIFDLGEEDDGLVFQVLELLEGERLSNRLERGPLETGVALDLLEQIAGALARAHDLGVVHRDLKPEHVFLVERGGKSNFVKLIDFGLAYLAREDQKEQGEALAGTPGYIAPEVLAGGAAGPAADLYALGVMLFEMVTGQHPFPARDPAALHRLHLKQPVPDPCSLVRSLPTEVGALTARLLEKDPARRYVNAYRLLEDCRACSQRLGVGLGQVATPAPVVPAPAQVARQTLTTSALMTVFLGRMAASAYPGGSAPEEVAERVERMWTVLSQLCKFEGELEVKESILANARARAHEASDAVALRIAELSRVASRLTRRMESARAELERLDRERREGARELRLVRRQIREMESTPAIPALSRLLQAAGVMAAHRQIRSEAMAKVEAKIARWAAESERAGMQADHLRAQLRVQNQRFEEEFARQGKRVAALYAELAQHLAGLEEAGAWLRRHFTRRRECRGLIAELDRIAPQAVRTPHGDSAEGREVRT
jgi:serine/threonine-protein kinase